jgi:hypothetical protein
VKRRALILLAAAWLSWPLAADNLPAAQPPGADWSRPASIQAGGITAAYPRAWHASTVNGTGIVIRSGKTRISVWNLGRLENTGNFPPRPEQFALDEDDRHFLSCPGFEGWNVLFTDHGQSVQAFVKLGPNTRKADAAEVLDRLVTG